VKKLFLAVMATALMLAVIVPPIHADQYYVIRDKNGQLAITDMMPGYGWDVEQGPFSTVDAATRAAGTGTRVQARRNIAPNFPQVIPKHSGESFVRVIP
jgi:hypothetical protein